MATKVTLESLHDNVTKRLQSMVDKTKSMQTYFARVAYPRYQRTQIERWMSENQSQMGKWKPLTSLYARQKLSKYSGYDYGGTKMLIGTGILFKSVVGPGDGHGAKFTNTSMEIKTTVSYAPYVAAHRPFMEFSKATVQAWKKDMQEYVTK